MIEALQFLAAAQNGDGGWGYAAGQASTVEATSAVALALRAVADDRRILERAVASLVGAQNPDGGWGVTREDRQSGWQTAWSVLALGGAGGSEDAVTRAIEWLLNVEILRVDEDAMQKADLVLGIDLSLRGWPWLPKQAAWVEPTALALLALAQAPATAALTARLEEAMTYLVSRRCLGGGWNVGNPLMFSQALPARAHPTAWVLLALARVAPERVLPEDLRALRSEVESDAGAQAFALGALALSANGQGAEGPLSQLQQLQQPGGSWDGNPFYTALATLALAGGAGL